MGKFWSTAENTESGSSLCDVPNINVRLQIQHIIHHWIKEHERESSRHIPMDMMNIILSFTYHTIFEQNYRCTTFEKCECIPIFKPGSTGASNECDYLLKLVLIGDFGVGKTSMMKLCTGQQDVGHDAIGIDFGFKRFEIDDIKFKLQIWDSSWLHNSRYARNASLASGYLRKVGGVVMMYDVTNRDSLQNIRDKWYEWVVNGVEANERKLAKRQYFQTILVGNKKDLIQDDAMNNINVTSKEVEELCDRLDISHHLETSVKTGENIEQMIGVLCKQILDFRKKHHRWKQFPFYE